MKVRFVSRLEDRWSLFDDSSIDGTIAFNFVLICRAERKVSRRTTFSSQNSTPKGKMKTVLVVLLGFLSFGTILTLGSFREKTTAKPVVTRAHGNFIRFRNKTGNEIRTHFSPTPRPFVTKNRVFQHRTPFSLNRPVQRRILASNLHSSNRNSPRGKPVSAQPKIQHRPAPTRPTWRNAAPQRRPFWKNSIDWRKWMKLEKKRFLFFFCSRRTLIFLFFSQFS